MELIPLRTIIYNDSVHPFNYVMDNSITLGGYYRNQPFREMFREVVGEQFYINGPFAGTMHRMEGVTIKMDSSIWVEGDYYEDVLVTLQYDVGWNEPYTECASVREFFAKGVGLIRRDFRNSPTDSVFITESELIEYHIYR